jgi:thioesterase domain-containing protein
MTSASELERTLHEEIPLSHAMGVRVTAYQDNTLQLAAPLAPNTNHKCTAFGGSLYSLAVLCGWGLLHLKLREAGLRKHIVIQASDIRYLLPVEEDMMAECRLDEAAFARFLHTLEKRGKGRLTLDAVIMQDGRPAVEFSGRYVVHS